MRAEGEAAAKRSNTGSLTDGSSAAAEASRVTYCSASLNASPVAPCRRRHAPRKKRDRAWTIRAFARVSLISRSASRKRAAAAVRSPRS